MNLATLLKDEIRKLININAENIEHLFKQHIVPKYHEMRSDNTKCIVIF